MASYIPMIYLHVRMDSAFGAIEKIEKKYAEGKFAELIDAVKYAEKHELKFNPFPVLENAFSEYCPPDDINERLLKAEIAGDREWADFWRKYATA